MHERRSPQRPSDEAPAIPCRVCFRHVRLDPDRIFRDGEYSVFRCPECGGSFPVRDCDAELPVADAAAGHIPV